MGLVDELASLVRERIYEGRYPSGSWLRQERLCVELGVSRTPLREAIRVLQYEGLLTVVPGQGAQVVSGDLDVLLDAYALRAVVDGLAARLAANHGGRLGHQQLRRLIQRQEAAITPWNDGSYSRANVDFHEEILHMSGNGFVIGQAPILRITAQLFAPVPLVRPSVAVRAIREHSLIADAIASGDGDASEVLARRHIETTALELQRAKGARSSTPGRQR